MTKKELNKLIAETVKEVIKEDEIDDRLEAQKIKLIGDALQKLIDARDELYKDTFSKLQKVKTEMDNVKKVMKSLTGRTLAKSFNTYTDFVPNISSFEKCLQKINDFKFYKFWMEKK